MHTDVVHVLDASTARIQSSVSASLSSARGCEAARDDDDIGSRDVVQRVVGDERQELVVGADLALLLGDEAHVGVGQALEDLVRPDDVEGGDAVEEETGDLHDCSDQVG